MTNGLIDWTSQEALRKYGPARVKAQLEGAIKAERRGKVSFGPDTSQVLGLEYGKYYEPEELEEWFQTLKDYSAWIWNEPGLGERLPYWVRGAQLGLSPEEYQNILEGAAHPFTEAEFKYLTGESELAPGGLRSIPAGLRATMIPQRGWKDPAEAWFKKQYPSISGAGKQQMKAGYGWREIVEGRAKFAPRVQTVRF